MQGGGGLRRRRMGREGQRYDGPGCVDGATFVSHRSLMHPHPRCLSQRAPPPPAHRRAAAGADPRPQPALLLDCHRLPQDPAGGAHAGQPAGGARAGGGGGRRRAEGCAGGARGVGGDVSCLCSGGGGGGGGRSYLAAGGATRPCSSHAPPADAAGSPLRLPPSLHPLYSHRSTRGARA